MYEWLKCKQEEYLSVGLLHHSLTLSNYSLVHLAVSDKHFSSTFQFSESPTVALTLTDHGHELEMLTSQFTT